MMPVETIAETFARDGYAVFENVFPESALRSISTEVDRVLEGRAAYLPPGELIYEPDTNPPRVRNAFRLQAFSPMFMDVARAPGIIGVVGTILGRPLRIYGSQVFAKPARVGTVVPRHQDMPYWPFDPYELVSAWIALDDSTLQNGCVRYVPGSHKFRILPHGPFGCARQFSGAYGQRQNGELEERAVEVRRGSCALHHCLTVHRREPNRSPDPRRGLIYIYMSPRVRLTDASKIRGSAEFPEL